MRWVERGLRWAAGPLVVLVLAACGGGGGDDPVARGRDIVEDVGCTACHDTGTATRIGPGWGETWGTEVPLEDGRTLVVDEEFLRRAVVDPMADVREGFRPGMPQVPLTDEEIDDVTAYLRDLAGG
jgi:cytochrome c oxidase subunit II